MKKIMWLCSSKSFIDEQGHCTRPEVMQHITAVQTDHVSLLSHPDKTDSSYWRELTVPFGKTYDFIVLDNNPVVRRSATAYGIPAIDTSPELSSETIIQNLKDIRDLKPDKSISQSRSTPQTTSRFQIYSLASDWNTRSDSQNVLHMCSTESLINEQGVLIRPDIIDKITFYKNNMGDAAGLMTDGNAQDLQAGEKAISGHTGKTPFYLTLHGKSLHTIGNNLDLIPCEDKTDPVYWRTLNRLFGHNHTFIVYDHRPDVLATASQNGMEVVNVSTDIPAETIIENLAVARQKAARTLSTRV